MDHNIGEYVSVRIIRSILIIGCTEQHQLIGYYCRRTEIPVDVSQRACTKIEAHVALLYEYLRICSLANID